MKYCNACQRNVTPKKEFNWVVFSLLMVMFGLGLLYIPFYLFSAPRCPICRGQDFSQAQMMA
jgi:hypothetical protein